MCKQGARNEIFAMQPAPVQVSYMGFPGTMGASYIDYLVTDEVGGEILFCFKSLLVIALDRTGNVFDYCMLNRS